MCLWDQRQDCSKNCPHFKYAELIAYPRYYRSELYLTPEEIRADLAQMSDREIVAYLTDRVKRNAQVGLNPQRCDFYLSKVKPG